MKTLNSYCHSYIIKCNRNDKKADQHIYNLCFNFINGMTSNKNDVELEVFFNLQD